MNRSFHRFALLLGACLLLVGAGLQFFPARPVESVSPSLAEQLPVQWPSGTVRDEPIATSDEMKRAVGEMLNYNEAVFRVYEGAGYRVSVYAAWWEAGRMSPRLVAGHTPDVCWPGNGWVRDREREVGHAVAADEFNRGGFLPAEVRVFTAGGRPEYVAFWHKVGPDIQSYGTGYAPPWWAVFAEIRRHGFNLRQEQLFVRVSSDTPLDRLFQKPELAELREALLRLGLRQ